MIVEIPTAGEPTLLDVHNFRELKVVGDPTGHAELGRIETAHVYLDPALLKSLAGAAAQDAAWRQSFADMVAFAAKHSWVDDAGFIRAHVEPHD